MFFRKRRYQVICIGSSSKDIFLPTDEGTILETPNDLTSKRKVEFEIGGKYRVGDRYDAVGGVAANVAQAIAKLGVRVAIMSKIGDDEIGRWILSRFRFAGVNTELIDVDKGTESDLSAIIVLKQDGERVIFHNRDANEQLVIDAKSLEGTEWIFVSSLNGDWEKKLTEVFDAAMKSAIPVAFNPGQHNLRENPKLILEMAARSDMLMLNKDEAIELIQKSDEPASPEQLDDEEFLIRTLAAAGAKTIALTDGERGAWGFTDGELVHCPATKVERVIDTTGAGDAFAAVFFASVAFFGKSVRDALRYGSVEGGSVVTRYGASSGQLTLSELEERVANLPPE
ncbi:MAG: carbohydrate kinase family protein [Candidatus Moranbacteria bacterium]|nr:carbohydrate kinase family protein [Candidatus Moranbacteria bacterium]